MTGSGLVLGADLELNLRSLNNVRHSVLTIRARRPSAFYPTSSELLLLLDGIPADTENTTDLNTGAELDARFQDVCPIFCLMIC